MTSRDDEFFEVLGGGGPGDRIFSFREVFHLDRLDLPTQDGNAATASSTMLRQ
jgi:hypothetical protein